MRNISLSEEIIPIAELNESQRFLNGVRQGLDDLAAGQVLSAAEVSAVIEERLGVQL